MVWINCLPCEPGVPSSIPAFTSLSDETKLWPRLHLILVIWWDFKYTNTTTDLGLHCLHMSHKIDARLIWVMFTIKNDCGA